MQYIYDYLARLGKPGLIISYILTLITLALLYTNTYPKDLLSEGERTFVVLGAFAAATYWFVRKMRSASKIDETLFKAPAITTLSELENNINEESVESFYIGTARDMVKFATWKPITKDFMYATVLKEHYDPSATYRPQQRSRIFFAQPDYVLGIRYTDGLFQFVVLSQVSNDLHEATQLISTYMQRGVRVDGEYEKLKDTPEQFTIKYWVKLGVIFFVVVICIVITGVLFSIFINP